MAELTWEDVAVADDAPQSSRPGRGAAPASGGLRWEDVAVPDDAPMGARPTAAAVPKPQNNDRGIMTPVVEWITGKGRREFPDMPQFFGNTSFPIATAGRLALGLATATDPAQERDIVAAAVPDAKFREDKFGNTIVTLDDGKDFYLNPAGMTALDVLRAFAQGGVYTATMGAGAGAGSALMRAGRGALTAAGTSAGLDAGATALGSDQGVNLPRAAIAGVTGGVFEGGAAIVNRLARRMASGGRPQEITVTARTELEKAGFKPEEITDELVTYFVRQARDAVDPQQAAVAASGQSLPVPVRMTRGDVTGKPSDQMFESLATKGAYGRSAEAVMGAVRDEQQSALRANIPTIQERLAGGRPTVTARGDAGAAAQAALVGKNRALGSKVDAAYEAARASNAGMAGADVQGLKFRIGQAAADYLDAAPVALRTMNDLDGLASTPNADALVSRLYAWRRKASSLAANAPNPTEAAALRNMVREFDAGMDDALKMGLIKGDEASVDLWKRAIKLRRGQTRLFQDGDLVADIVETEARSGRPTLKVAPEAASNLIFGAERAGLTSRPEMARELKRMRSVLGPESTEWNAIREEAFMRLAQAGEGAFSGPERAFSGVNFKKALDAALEKNPAVMRTLFSPDEQKLLNQFANVAARVTGRVPGGDNPSGTAVAVSNIVQKMAGASFAGSKLGALLQQLPIGTQLRNITNTVRIINRANNPVMTGATNRPGPAGAVGAVTGPPLLEGPP